MELFDEMIEKEKAIMSKKGPDYTNENADRLANFKEVARMLGITPLQVLGVYLAKHQSSIMKFCRTGKLSGEPISEKVADSRNYEGMLMGLVEDLQEEEDKDVFTDSHNYKRFMDITKELEEEDKEV